MALMPYVIFWFMAFHSQSVSSTTSVSLKVDNKVLHRSKRDISTYSDDKKWKCPETAPTLCFYRSLDHSCNSHRDCPGDHLCCLFACSYDCARPVRVQQFVVDDYEYDVPDESYEDIRARVDQMHAPSTPSRELVVDVNGQMESSLKNVSEVVRQEFSGDVHGVMKTDKINKLKPSERISQIKTLKIINQKNGGNYRGMLRSILEKKPTVTANGREIEKIINPEISKLFMKQNNYKSLLFKKPHLETEFISANKSKQKDEILTRKITKSHKKSKAKYYSDRKKKKELLISKKYKSKNIVHNSELTHEKLNPMLHKDLKSFLKPEKQTAYFNYNEKFNVTNLKESFKKLLDEFNEEKTRKYNLIDLKVKNKLNDSESKFNPKLDKYMKSLLKPKEQSIKLPSSNLNYIEKLNATNLKESFKKLLDEFKDETSRKYNLIDLKVKNKLNDSESIDKKPNPKLDKYLKSLSKPKKQSINLPPSHLSYIEKLNATNLKESFKKLLDEFNDETSRKYNLIDFKGKNKLKVTDSTDEKPNLKLDKYLKSLSKPKKQSINLPHSHLSYIEKLNATNLKESFKKLLDQFNYETNRKYKLIDFKNKNKVNVTESTDKKPNPKLDKDMKSLLKLKKQNIKLPPSNLNYIKKINATNLKESFKKVLDQFNDDINKRYNMVNFDENFIFKKRKSTMHDKHSPITNLSELSKERLVQNVSKEYSFTYASTSGKVLQGNDGPGVIYLHADKAKSYTRPGFFKSKNGSYMRSYENCSDRSKNVNYNENMNNFLKAMIEGEKAHIYNATENKEHYNQHAGNIHKGPYPCKPKKINSIEKNLGHKDTNNYWNEGIEENMIENVRKNEKRIGYLDYENKQSKIQMKGDGHRSNSKDKFKTMKTNTKHYSERVLQKFITPKTLDTELEQQEHKDYPIIKKNYQHKVLNNDQFQGSHRISHTFPEKRLIIKDKNVLNESKSKNDDFLYKSLDEYSVKKLLENNQKRNYINEGIATVKYQNSIETYIASTKNESETRVRSPKSQRNYFVSIDSDDFVVKELLENDQKRNYFDAIPTLLPQKDIETSKESANEESETNAVILESDKNDFDSIDLEDFAVEKLLRKDQNRNYLDEGSAPLMYQKNIVTPKTSTNEESETKALSQEFDSNDFDSIDLEDLVVEKLLGNEHKREGLNFNFGKQITASTDRNFNSTNPNYLYFRVKDLGDNEVEGLIEKGRRGEEKHNVDDEELYTDINQIRNQSRSLIDSLIKNEKQSATPLKDLFKQDFSQNFSELLTTENKRNNFNDFYDSLIESELDLRENKTRYIQIVPNSKEMFTTDSYGFQISSHKNKHVKTSHYDTNYGLISQLINEEKRTPSKQIEKYIISEKVAEDRQINEKSLLLEIFNSQGKPENANESYEFEDETNEGNFLVRLLYPHLNVSRPMKVTTSTSKLLHRFTSKPNSNPTSMRASNRYSINTKEDLLNQTNNFVMEYASSPTYNPSPTKASSQTRYLTSKYGSFISKTSTSEYVPSQYNRTSKIASSQNNNPTNEYTSSPNITRAKVYPISLTTNIFETEYKTSLIGSFLKEFTARLTNVSKKTSSPISNPTNKYNSRSFNTTRNIFASTLTNNLTNEYLSSPYDIRTKEYVLDTTSNSKIVYESRLSNSPSLTEEYESNMTNITSKASIAASNLSHTVPPYSIHTKEYSLRPTSNFKLEHLSSQQDASFISLKRNFPIKENISSRINSHVKVSSTSNFINKYAFSSTLNYASNASSQTSRLTNKHASQLNSTPTKVHTSSTFRTQTSEYASLLNSILNSTYAMSSPTSRKGNYGSNSTINHTKNHVTSVINIITNTYASRLFNNPAQYSSSKTNNLTKPYASDFFNNTKYLSSTISIPTTEYISNNIINPAKQYASSPYSTKTLASSLFSNYTKDYTKSSTATQRTEYVSSLTSPSKEFVSRTTNYHSKIHKNLNKYPVVYYALGQTASPAKEHSILFNNQTNEHDLGSLNSATKQYVGKSFVPTNSTKHIPTFPNMNVEKINSSSSSSLKYMQPENPSSNFQGVINVSKNLKQLPYNPHELNLNLDIHDNDNHQKFDEVQEIRYPAHVRKKHVQLRLPAKGKRMFGNSKNATDNIRYTRNFNSEKKHTSSDDSKKFQKEHPISLKLTTVSMIRNIEMDKSYNQELSSYLASSTTKLKETHDNSNQLSITPKWHSHLKSAPTSRRISDTTHRFINLNNNPSSTQLLKLSSLNTTLGQNFKMATTTPFMTEEHTHVKLDNSIETFEFPASHITHLDTEVKYNRLNKAHNANLSMGTINNQQNPVEMPKTNIRTTNNNFKMKNENIYGDFNEERKARAISSLNMLKYDFKKPDKRNSIEIGELIALLKKNENKFVDSQKNIHPSENLIFKYNTTETAIRLKLPKNIASNEKNELQDTWYSQEKSVIIVPFEDFSQTNKTDVLRFLNVHNRNVPTTISHSTNKLKNPNQTDGEKFLRPKSNLPSKSNSVVKEENSSQVKVNNFFLPKTIRVPTEATMLQSTVLMEDSSLQITNDKNLLQQPNIPKSILPLNTIPNKKELSKDLISGVRIHEEILPSLYEYLYPPLMGGSEDGNYFMGDLRHRLVRNAAHDESVELMEPVNVEEPLQDENHDEMYRNKLVLTIR